MSAISAKTVGAIAAASIVAVIVAIVLITGDSSDPAPPAPITFEVGEPATASPAEPTIATERPSGSQHGDREDEAQATEGNNVEPPRDEQSDTPPAPTDVAEERTPTPGSSVPPELGGLRDVPALER